MRDDDSDMLPTRYRIRPHHLVIALLWIGAVIDPIGGMFGIRYFSLALATITTLLLGAKSLSQDTNISYRGGFIIALTIIFPIYGLILFLIYGARGPFIDTSYIASGLIITFSLLYTNINDCKFGIYSLIYAARILAFLTIFTFILQIYSMNEIIGFFTARDVALIGYRQYSGIEFPYIYFLASPILIYIISYDFHQLNYNKNAINLTKYLISSGALLLSGTRAHIIIAVLFPLIYFVLNGRKGILFRTIITINIFIVILIFSPEFRELFLSFFVTNEINNSMKLTLLSQYAEIFSDPYVILFGQGFNAHEWSYVFRSMVYNIDFTASKTELTYIELYRVYGIFIATIFIILLFRFVRSTRYIQNEGKWIYPALFVYMINAALNPYLFSVNGLLPIGLIVSILIFYPINKRDMT